MLIRLMGEFWGSDESYVSNSTVNANFFITISNVHAETMLIQIMRVDWEIFLEVGFLTNFLVGLTKDWEINYKLGSRLDIKLDCCREKQDFRIEMRKLGLMKFRFPKAFVAKT